MELILSDHINDEMLSTLARAYNELKDQEVLNIYFSSPGGHVDIMEAMACMINRNAFRTTFTVTYDIQSCGFLLFFSIICGRELLPSAFGMIHLKTSTGEIKEGLLASNIANFMGKRMKESLEKSSEFYRSLGVTEKEINDVKEGKEVYFEKSRLEKMLKKHLKQIEKNGI